MKKMLINPGKKYFKANLHCHSTISDGTKTPEELKEMYAEHGYSIIAYTDHNVLIDHSDLSDDSFLALNGYEMDITEECDFWPAAKTCHLCYIALEPENMTQVCYHRTEYCYEKYRQLVKFDNSKPDFVRKYNPDCINTMIAEGRENGFFVTYNHPSWSMESLNEYGAYKGMNAMEICNYGCFSAGYDDYNEKEYDDMLRGGQRIFCIATDDNHNIRKDSFGGFTVINADKLEYRAVTGALENGDFYASQGPEIYELWYEDGKIGIKCSDAKKIVLNTGLRRTAIEYAEEGEALNTAVFDVEKTDIYVRITVTDSEGNHANTNAYFTDDLM